MKQNQQNHPQVQTSRLIIKNLPPSMDEQSLKRIFEEHGEVTDCKIMFKNERNRRFAFIGFRNKDEAVKAQNKLDKTFLSGFKVLVEFSALKKAQQNNKAP